jgi:hypothetical protein
MSGMRSTARSVRSSASAKSSANQPVHGWSSTTLVVRRSANSERLPTSVDQESSLSWRTTRTPSRLTTTSGSISSAPSSMASS